MEKKKFNSIKDSIMKIISSNNKEVIGQFYGEIKNILLLLNDKIIIEIKDEFAIYKGKLLNKVKYFQFQKKKIFRI